MDAFQQSTKIKDVEERSVINTSMNKMCIACHHHGRRKPGSKQFFISSPI